MSWLIRGKRALFLARGEMGRIDLFLFLTVIKVRKCVRIGMVWFAKNVGRWGDAFFYIYTHQDMRPSRLTCFHLMVRSNWEKFKSLAGLRIDVLELSKFQFVKKDSFWRRESQDHLPCRRIEGWGDALRWQGLKWNENFIDFKHRRDCLCQISRQDIEEKAIIGDLTILHYVLNQVSFEVFIYVCSGSAFTFPFIVMQFNLVHNTFAKFWLEWKAGLVWVAWLGWRRQAGFCSVGLDEWPILSPPRPWPALNPYSG